MKKTKRILPIIIGLVLLLCFSLPVFAAADEIFASVDGDLTLADVSVSSQRFSDVSDSDWFAPYVYQMADMGLVNGKGNGIFDPMGAITRAEFAKILAVGSGEDLTPYDRTSVFSDCNNSWARKYINWAVDRGIVYGVSSTQYAPNQPITREAISTMIHRYVKYRGICIAKIVSPMNFKDSGKISDWARESVFLMQRGGVLNGTPQGYFAPQSNATRGECCKILSALLECKIREADEANLRVFRNTFGNMDSSCQFFLADVTHDDMDDLIIVQRKAADSYETFYYVNVYTQVNGSVKLLYSEKAGYSHVDMKGYFLLREADGCYLVYYTPAVYGGICETYLDVFSFDANGNRIYQCKEYNRHNPTTGMVDIPADYSGYRAITQKGQAYVNKSTVLADTNQLKNGIECTRSSFYQAFGNMGR